MLVLMRLNVQKLKNKEPYLISGLKNKSKFKLKL